MRTGTTDEGTQSSPGGPGGPKSPPYEVCDETDRSQGRQGEGTRAATLLDLGGPKRAALRAKACRYELTARRRRVCGAAS